MTYKMLAGGYDREGFAMLSFDESVLKLDRKVAAKNPSYMLLEGDRLYTVEEMREGGAASWKKDGDSFVCDGEYPTFGSAPCHVFRYEDVLILANYGSGSLARCTIGKGGELNGTLPLIRHGEGSGVVKGRQEGPHAHFAMLVPGGKYIAACDLGMDKIVFYDAKTMHDDEPAHTDVRVPDGCGPRHAAFLSKNDIWYVACELSSDILVYRGYAQDAVLLQKIALTEGIVNAPAAIRISPDEKTVIVSNRGEDTISVFDIAGDGTITPCGKISAGCEQPRDAAFSPDGKYLALACQRGGKLLVFAFEGKESKKVAEYPIEQVSSVIWY